MDSMSIIAAIAVVGLLLVIAAAGFLKRRPGKLNVAIFQQRWQELQGLCGSKETWPLAVIKADTLLDEALKKLHFKGKTMGERLVSAQHSLSNNDSAWYGHKLRNKLVHEADTVLKERDVKDALIGIRQALKDLGALK